MQKTRRWLSVLIAIAAAPAGATGFGATGSGATLGQPLDFTVQLRLDPGDTLAAGCLTAEVMVGERRLPAGLVRASHEMQGSDTARVHVRTTVTIDEPVVGVDIQAGCTARVSRRFVVLADPPVVAASVAALPAATAVTAPAFAATPADVPSAAAAPAPATAAPQVVDATLARPVAAGDARPARTSARQRGPRMQAQARGEAAPRRGGGPRADAPRRQRRAAAPAAAAAADATPRLRLEAAEPARADSPETTLAVEQALLAVAQAASAARDAAAAASAAQQRIQALEREVQTLRSEVQAERSLALRLREQLRRNDDGARWTWPLLAALLVLAGVALWLARRLTLLQREQQARWRAASAGADAASAAPAERRDVTSPTPFVTADPRPQPAQRTATSPAWPPPAPAEPWTDSLQTTQPIAPRLPARDAAAEAAHERTDVLPPRAAAVGDGGAPRDVSIEELIDLEQQAEFFVVLGQDEAAIELLAEHVRHTGGGSPLPYLKLLEIYHRRGDRTDYERTRERFNQRFNAYAPQWGNDLAAGRSLEDYAGIVPRLQQAWPRPLDAMAEMEALLFRKSRGDLFDLPAYRELLFLYALARDLLDREAADTGNVDLLLPLTPADAPPAEFSSTQPLPHFTLDGGMPGRPHHDTSDDRPTAPLDFDLSTGAEAPTSIFDAQEEPPRRGAPKPRR